jgi:hypothetical protein
VAVDDKTSWKLWPPSLVHRNTKHNAFAWRRDGHHSAQQKGRPKAAPSRSRPYRSAGQQRPAQDRRPQQGRQVIAVPAINLEQILDAGA